ncbi:hypothetical protein L2E82_01088 [Cichorium intybus]|uniref:Uncharacterized protein n=1 Tax=Cichorium intybus TaxID=13427 RepID=A0ACB9GYB7_CICIN|nr:hypothetical protein L2E82_01088 [Cichorium intybus]
MPPILNYGLHKDPKTGETNRGRKVFISILVLSKLGSKTSKTNVFIERKLGVILISPKQDIVGGIMIQTSMMSSRL